MNKRSKDALIRHGFGVELIEKLAHASLTLSGVSGMNNAALLNIGFTAAEVNEIIEKSTRRPIDRVVIESIVAKSGGCCVFCADGNNTQPFEVHHIEEYNVSQNNDEDNLLLICPTHHTTVHKNNITSEFQKSVKRRWEQIWQIAAFYQQKGIPFPFSSFSYLDYSYKGNILEIFYLRAPTPSVSLYLLQEGLRQEFQQILNNENRILLAGKSGSGKSTLARGIAGIDTTHAAFMYIGSHDTKNTLSEIAMFLSVAVKPVTVIVDNANTLLSTDQIEYLLGLASPRKRLIVVHTRSDNGEDKRLENHFLDAVYPVEWPTIKTGILKKLQTHEGEIIDYLNERGLNDSGIGSGRLQQSLTTIINQYASNVDTVWQFIYLLTSGIHRMDKLQVELYNDERMDLLVLFISIKQIAQFEAATSIIELMSLYTTHPSLSTIAAPEQQWLKQQMKKLLQQHIIKLQRGNYITVHRQFAIKFIEHCYLKTRADTEVFLNDIFSNPKRIKEIVRLWSWLNHTTARIYVQQWYRSLDLRCWQMLVDEAFTHDLMTVSAISELMHRISVNGYVPLQVCFGKKAQDIATRVNAERNNTLYYLHQLFLNLHHDCPDVVQESLDLIPKDSIAQMVKTIEPEHFEYLTWLFNTIVQKNRRWADEFSRLCDANDFIALIDKVKKGDVSSLMNILEFERGYIHNIKRSQFRHYTAAFARLLKNCHLQEINMDASSLYRGYFMEFYLYPGEIAEVVNSLDQTTLSVDFVECSPRHWGNLLTISILAQHINTDVIRNIVDGIDTDKLKENILRYTDPYYYELRLLIHQLAYGSEGKKKDFAHMLRPIIEKILKVRPAKDIEDVLHAFFKLDEEWASKTLLQQGLAVPEIKKPSTSHSPLNDVKERFAEMDAKGVDYDMEKTRFRYPEEDFVQQGNVGNSSSKS